MPAARRRTDATAPPERWQLLGRLLEDRRKELGYTYRQPAFERDSGVNRRMAADIEKAAKDRINRFMPGTLHVIARGYQVTEKSMRAVLRGDADALTPVTGALSPAARRHYREINERRFTLAAQGILDPDGAQMFPGAPDDAQAWDGIGARLPIGERVQFIADLRRWEEAGRVPNSGMDATSA